jgi:hypothetical protein
MTADRDTTLPNLVSAFGRAAYASGVADACPTTGGADMTARSREAEAARVALDAALLSALAAAEERARKAEGPPRGNEPVRERDALIAQLEEAESERDALAARVRGMVDAHTEGCVDSDGACCSACALALSALASSGSAPVAPARDAERSGRLAAEERADALAEHVSDLVRYIGRVDQVSPADDLRSDECLDEWDDLRATVEEARLALAPVAPEGRETEGCPVCRAASAATAKTVPQGYAAGWHDAMKRAAPETPAPSGEPRSAGPCKACDGSGEVTRESQFYPGMWLTHVCTDCGGVIYAAPAKEE